MTNFLLLKKALLFANYTKFRYIGGIQIVRVEQEEPTCQKGQTIYKPKNTGHLEWNALGDFSEFKTNGDSKEAL